MSERIIPFPFQKKELQDGEKLPLVDHVMEESKTFDKWQIVGGVAISVFNPAAGAALIGVSLVSHEITRDELRVRREKRKVKQAEQARNQLPQAA